MANIPRESGYILEIGVTVRLYTYAMAPERGDWESKSSMVAVRDGPNDINPVKSAIRAQEKKPTNIPQNYNNV